MGVLKRVGVRQRQEAGFVDIPVTPDQPLQIRRNSSMGTSHLTFFTLAFPVLSRIPPLARLINSHCQLPDHLALCLLRCIDFLTSCLLLLLSQIVFCLRFCPLIFILLGQGLWHRGVCPTCSVARYEKQRQAPATVVPHDNHESLRDAFALRRVGL